VLSSHYRSPLTYSEEILEAAERGADRLRYTANTELDDPRIKYNYVFDADSYRHRFIEAMDDDFNTAKAIAALFDLARDINRASESGYSVAQAQQVIRELGGVLGLTLKPPQFKPLEAEPFMELQKAIIAKIREEKLDHVIEKIASELDQPDTGVKTAEPYINSLRDIRNALRSEKKFQLADEIRAELDKLGVTLEDTPRGTVWRRKR